MGFLPSTVFYLCYGCLTLTSVTHQFVNAKIRLYVFLGECKFWSERSARNDRCSYTYKSERTKAGAFCNYSNNFCYSATLGRDALDRPVRSGACLMETFSSIYFSHLCAAYLACLDPVFGFVAGESAHKKKNTDCIVGNGIIYISIPFVLSVQLSGVCGNKFGPYSLYSEFSNGIGRDQQRLVFYSYCNFAVLLKR